jgi:1,4-dihydroxy-2-naphthoate octaprenyltransferase
MLAYGPMILCGAYLVQRGSAPAWLLHLAAPLGIMISAFLFVNEMPDARADGESGKRTLVVRLGKARASRVFALFPLVAFGYQLALPLLAPVSAGVWLGFIGLPFGIAAAQRVWTRHARTADIVPAQGWTLLSFVLLALGGGVGLLVFN